MQATVLEAPQRDNKGTFFEIEEFGLEGVIHCAHVSHLSERDARRLQKPE